MVTYKHNQIITRDTWTSNWCEQKQTHKNISLGRGLESEQKRPRRTAQARGVTTSHKMAQRINLTGTENYRDRTNNQRASMGLCTLQICYGRIAGDFCGTNNSGKGCCFWLFCLPWGTFHPTGLPCSALISRNVLRFIITWYTLFSWYPRSSETGLCVVSAQNKVGLSSPILSSTVPWHCLPLSATRIYGIFRYVTMQFQSWHLVDTYVQKATP